MKTVIITGANSGLGFETAKKVARNADFKVVLACRNSEKAELAHNYAEPETETEKILCELVSTITTAEEFGITDDLYTLGFSSLTLVTVCKFRPHSHFFFN